MTKEPIRAGIYCRLSLAKYGDTTNVNDQEARGRQLCEHRGWQVVTGCGYPEPNGVYTDNSRSAWQPNRKRPAWDTMLKDIDAGKLSAIVVYHGDRLMRRPEDLGTLLGVARAKSIKLASLIGDRDLSNPDDEYILWIEAAGFGRASADTSRRVRRDIERRRQAGIANSGGRGGRLFGFESDGVTWAAPDRCVIATREEIGEVDFVREVHARALAGDGIRHMAAGLAARGVTTTAGNPMHPLAVRRILSSPRYAGLMPDGVHQAAWQPMVKREDWEAVNVLIGGRASLLTAGHNARRYLLSGIARCGVCGSRMQVLPAHTSGQTGRVVAARYGCLSAGCRKVFRVLAHLDAFVTAAVVAKLNDPANPAARMPETPQLAGEFAALTMQRAEVEAMVVDHTAGNVALLLRRLSSIDARLGQLRDLAAGSARSRLLASHAGLTRAGFDALPLASRRALVAAVFSVTVLPASKRGPGFRPGDVRLSPPTMP